LTLTKSSVSPDSVSVQVDDVDVDGGPWLVGDTLTDTIEIDDYLFNSGVAGDHTIRLSCLHRGGDVDVSLVVAEIGIAGGVG